MSKNNFRSMIVLVAVVFAVSIFGFDLLARAQKPENQNDNANATTPKSKTKSRRRGSSRLRANAKATQETDLSGTYSGTFDCNDAGVAGDTTLTITGNQFNLSDGKSGRITTATTRGYTAVAMQFGEFSMPASGGATVTAPTIVSMRAKKTGDRLTLTTVPGASRRCSFLPTGTTARTRRGRRTHQAPAATNATGTETANPAETRATSAEPATPAASRRGRGRRGRGNMNSNMNMNSNANASPTATPPRR